MIVGILEAEGAERRSFAKYLEVVEFTLVFLCKNLNLETIFSYEPLASLYAFDTEMFNEGKKICYI